MNRSVCRWLVLAAFLVPSLGFGQNIAPQNNQVPQQIQPPAPPANPPKVARKIYQSKAGEIYLQSSQPLYFNIAGSKDGPTFLMQSKAGLINRLKHKPVQPFKFKDGDGRHTLVHPSGEGHYWSGRKKLETVEDENIFYFHIDDSPPITGIKSKGAVRAGTKKGVYYGGPVQFSLPSVDHEAKLKSNVSGVYGVFYSVDGAGFERYSGPVAFEGERLHEIRYYGIDQVGNQEALHTFQFRIDTTSPSSKIYYKGIESGEFLASSTRLLFRGADQDSGLRQVSYKITGPKKTVGVYRGPVGMKNWPDGRYTVRYGATDRVRNHEQEQTAAFYLDTKPPRLKISTEGPGFWSGKKLYVAAATKVNLTATDQSSGVSWVRYARGKKTRTYKQPFSVPAKKGKFEVKAWASDKVRNQSRVYRYRLVMDPKPPITKYKLIGPKFSGSKGRFVSSKTKIRLLASDQSSGVKKKFYQDGDKPEQGYRKPFSLAEEGKHRLGYRSKDQVENTERMNHVTLVVDNTPPTVEARFSVGEMDVGVYPRGSLLFALGSDRSSGLQKILMSINGGKQTLYEQPPRFTKKGKYKVLLTAIDRVGNRASTTMKFKIR